MNEIKVGDEFIYKGGYDWSLDGTYTSGELFTVGVVYGVTNIGGHCVNGGDIRMSNNSIDQTNSWFISPEKLGMYFSPVGDPIITTIKVYG